MEGGAWQPERRHTLKGHMKKSTKLRTVLVYCLNVDSDGNPVTRYGNLASDKRSYCYTWELQRRGEKWLKANPALWKPIKI